MDVETRKARMQEFMKLNPKFATSGWSKNIHPKVKLDSYDGTTVIFKYTVAEEDTNLFGTLHGGAIATLADNLTTFAAVVCDRQQRPGVSVGLQVDYMIAPKIGETVTIECICDKTGKFLSFSSAIFYNDKREIIAKAKHTKFLGEPTKAKL